MSVNVKLVKKLINIGVIDLNSIKEKKAKAKTKHKHKHKPKTPVRSCKCPSVRSKETRSSTTTQPPLVGAGGGRSKFTTTVGAGGGRSRTRQEEADFIAATTPSPMRPNTDSLRLRDEQLALNTRQQEHKAAIDSIGNAVGYLFDNIDTAPTFGSSTFTPQISPQQQQQFHQQPQPQPQQPNQQFHQPHPHLHPQPQDKTGKQYFSRQRDAWEEFKTGHKGGSFLQQYLKGPKGAGIGAEKGYSPHKARFLTDEEEEYIDDIANIVPSIAGRIRRAEPADKYEGESGYADEDEDMSSAFVDMKMKQQTEEEAKLKKRYAAADEDDDEDDEDEADVAMKSFKKHYAGNDDDTETFGDMKMKQQAAEEAAAEKAAKEAAEEAAEEAAIDEAIKRAAEEAAERAAAKEARATARAEKEAAKEAKIAQEREQERKDLVRPQSVSGFNPQAYKSPNSSYVLDDEDDAEDVEFTREPISAYSPRLLRSGSSSPRAI